MRLKQAERALTTLDGGLRRNAFVRKSTNEYLLDRLMPRKNTVDVRRKTKQSVRFLKPLAVSEPNNRSVGQLPKTRNLIIKLHISPSKSKSTKM